MNGTCPCTRPTQGWLCGQCLAGFLDDLAKVPELMDRLEASKVGDTPRPSNGSTGPTGSKPPVNLTITQIMLNVEVMMQAMWAHTGHTGRATDNNLTMERVTQHIQRLAAMKCIISYRDQLTTELWDTNQFLNPTPNKALIGPCPNDGTPLTAAEAQDETRCDTCGNTYQVHEYRLNRILQALGDYGQPVRASEAVRRFNNAGLTITPMNIKNWVLRGNLHPVAIDEHQRRLFSIPDIYTLTTS